MKCRIYIKFCVTFWAPRGLGDLERMAFYFQGAGEHLYYVRGAREQAHNFRDLGSLAKMQKNKEKIPFCWIFFFKFRPPL